MTFEEVKKLDDTYIMHTFKRKPVCFVEGEGVTVKDEEGKEYLDLLSGIGVDSLGHCHPRVAEAIAEQAQKLIHVSNYFYIEKRGEVAKLISEMANECIPTFFRAPWKTFFANSGRRPTNARSSSHVSGRRRSLLAVTSSSCLKEASMVVRLQRLPLRHSLISKSLSNRFQKASSLFRLTISMRCAIFGGSTPVRSLPS